MDELTRAFQRGPSGGVAAGIVAIGLAVLLVAWKAIPVFVGWVKALEDFRASRAVTDARISALAGLTAEAHVRINALMAENARLRAELERLRLLVDSPSGPAGGAVEGVSVD